MDLPHIPDHQERLKWAMERAGVGRMELDGTRFGASRNVFRAGQRIQWKYAMRWSPKLGVPPEWLVGGKEMGRGFVYLHKAWEWTKIGLTTNNRRRLWNHNVSCPFKVKSVHVVETEDPMLLEEKLHYECRDFRCKQEWFHLSEKQLKQAIKMMEEHKI